MRAYLDNNIFVYIENGSLDSEHLKQLIDRRIEKIFYSSAHLQEADKILGCTEQERIQRIDKRLETIEKVTSCNYLYQNLDNKVFHQTEKPRKVLETIREVPLPNGSMKLLANLMNEEQKELLRESLGLDTSRLNNYLPSEVVEHLNKKLTTWGQGHSFMEMLDLGISYHPLGHSFGLSNRIAGVFELLDLFGYWKDKATEKSNYARLWDSNHTFFAAHCDYFISDDKRTRIKARVVYDIYEIKTRVLSSKGEE